MSQRLHVSSCLEPGVVRSSVDALGTHTRRDAASPLIAECMTAPYQGSRDDEGQRGCRDGNRYASPGEAATGAQIEGWARCER